MINWIKGTRPSLSLLFALDIVSSIALALIVLANFWLFASANPMIWVDQIADDAYYYLGIARSLAEHGRFEFLPPFQTNGFQPLWQAILALTALVAGTSTRTMVLECYALSVGFTALFIFLSRQLNGSALAGVLVTVLFPTSMLLGMETVMLPAFALLFFASRGWQIRGVLGTFIFLSRLDAISLVVARDVYAFIRRRDVDFRHYSIIAPVAIAYVAFNYIQFGVLLPVSGLSKSLHMIPLENITLVKHYVVWSLPAIVFLAIVLIAKALSGSRPIGFKHGEELAASTMATIACAFYYGSLSGWPLWLWYAWAPMLVTYYALLEVFEVLQSDFDRRRYVRSSAAVTVVIGVLFWAGSAGYASSTIRLVRQALFPVPLTATFARKNLELVDWVKSQGLPRGTMFAMGDRAGSFGFFLGEDYRFLHTEGLVADAAYYTAMKKDGGLSYVEQQPIDYWVGDREQYLKSDSVIGVPEPIQALSMHKGAYLICFDKSAIINDQSYLSSYSPAHDEFEQRYVFNMKGRVNCPDQLKAQFESLRAGYGTVHAVSLPLESAAFGWINPQFKRYLGF